MDEMERLKVRQSIKDAISILDSAPIRPDMVMEANIVQLTNRVPIAHLALERGLKALIADILGIDVRETKEHGHSLNKLYQSLCDCDSGSSDYLSAAFDDAVSFFGYNVKAKGFGYLRTLNDYLSKVGTEKTFELLRYWAIGETGQGESSIQYILPPIHRELLCALWCLFLPTRRDTVSDRVEREVGRTMSKRLSSIVGTDNENSVGRYIDRLREGNYTGCSALEEASHSNFTIGEDEFIDQALRETFDDLQQSDDPAVRYFVRRLGYFPRGSQPPNPGVDPAVEWLNQAQTKGKVSTPAGTCLGFIERYADGGWGIIPAEEGLVQVADVANARKDALHYLVNRLTRQVTVILDGQEKQLRIVNERDFFRQGDAVWSPDFTFRSPTYYLEFWDTEHGLRLGDVISVELQSDGSNNSVAVLEGTVSGVSEHKVSVAGIETFMLKSER